MSEYTFQGPQGKGAMRRHRDKKRHEAQQRAERATIARNLTRLANEAQQATQRSQATSGPREVTVTLTADPSGFVDAVREAARQVGGES